MSTYSEKEASAKSRLFSLFGEQVTYNGSDVTAIIEGGNERFRNMTASIAFSIRVQQSDVSAPQVGDTVIYSGTQYRTGEGIYPDGGDWVIPIIQDYIEV